MIILTDTLSEHTRRAKQVIKKFRNTRGTTKNPSYFTAIHKNYLPDCNNSSKNLFEEQS